MYDGDFETARKDVTVGRDIVRSLAFPVRMILLHGSECLHRTTANVKRATNARCLTFQSRGFRFARRGTNSRRGSGGELLPPHQWTTHPRTQGRWDVEIDAKAAKLKDVKWTKPNISFT